MAQKEAGGFASAPHWLRGKAAGLSAGGGAGQAPGAVQWRLTAEACVRAAVSSPFQLQGSGTSLLSESCARAYVCMAFTSITVKSVPTKASRFLS